MTFSIVAVDTLTGEIGIAVASKFPAVGSVVPWIDLRGGAVATQANVHVKLGSRGLSLLKKGLDPENVLKDILSDDKLRETRQIGIVDIKGNSAGFTGSECYPVAMHISTHGVTVQGNMLASEEIVPSMLETFENTDGDLSEKLLCALEEGQRKGGDKRGQQSASLLVYNRGRGYGGSDKYVDVRIDNSRTAVSDLRRAFEVFSLALLEREKQSEITQLTDELYYKIGRRLRENGFINREIYIIDEIQAVFLQWLHHENFENKIRSDGFIWNSILDYLFSQKT